MKVYIENIGNYIHNYLMGGVYYVAYWKRYKGNDKPIKEKKGIFLKSWGKEWKTKEESRKNNKQYR